MMDSLKNEMLSFAVIAVVVILLAYMSRRREKDFQRFDKNEEQKKEK